MGLQVFQVHPDTRQLKGRPLGAAGAIIQQPKGPLPCSAPGTTGRAGLASAAGGSAPCPVSGKRFPLGGWLPPKPLLWLCQLAAAVPAPVWRTCRLANTTSNRFHPPKPFGRSLPCEVSPLHVSEQASQPPARSVSVWGTVVPSGLPSFHTVRFVIHGVIHIRLVHADADVFASLPFPVELHKADELLRMSLSGKVQVDARGSPPGNRPPPSGGCHPAKRASHGAECFSCPVCLLSSEHRHHPQVGIRYSGSQR